MPPQQRLRVTINKTQAYLTKWQFLSFLHYFYSFLSSYPTFPFLKPTFTRFHFSSTPFCCLFTNVIRGDSPLPPSEHHCNLQRILQQKFERVPAIKWCPKVEMLLQSCLCFNQMIPFNKNQNFSSGLLMCAIITVTNGFPWSIWTESRKIKAYKSYGSKITITQKGHSTFCKKNEFL